MSTRNPYMLCPELPPIEERRRPPIFNRRDRIKAIAALVFTVAAAAPACTDFGSSNHDKPEQDCKFSPETTTFTPAKGMGADAIALQVEGVTYDVCLTDAKAAIAELNPDKSLNAPRYDDTFNIPVSVSLVPAEG